MCHQGACVPVTQDKCLRMIFKAVEGGVKSQIHQNILIFVDYIHLAWNVPWSSYPNSQRMDFPQYRLVLPNAKPQPQGYITALHKPVCIHGAPFSGATYCQRRCLQKGTRASSIASMTATLGSAYAEEGTQCCRDQAWVDAFIFRISFMYG